MTIKKAASKAYIVCGGMVLIVMLGATVYALFDDGLKGKDLFAAPLLGFYAAIPAFIILYPILFVVIFLIDIYKSKRSKT